MVIQVIKTLELSVWAKSLQSCSDSLQPYGLGPTRLLCPWDSSGKNTGMVAMPSSGDFPNSGIEHLSVTALALADEFFTTRTTWEVKAPKVLGIEVKAP